MAHFDSYFDDDEQVDARKLPVHRRVVEFFASRIRRVRRAIGWTIWKCLNLFRVDKVFAIAEGFFRRCQQGVDWLLLNTIFSKRSQQVTEARDGFLQKCLILWATFLETIGIWSERSPLFRGILFPFRTIQPYAYGVVQFFANWITTRNYRQLLPGIPVMLMVSTMATLAILIPLKSNQAKARHYIEAAQVATDNKDYDAARLYHRKISQLQDNSDKADIGAFLLAKDEGNSEEANRLARKIARVDEPGNPHSHYLVARAIALNEIKPDDEDPLELMKTHLDHTLSVDSSHIGALHLLAFYHKSKGNYEQAIATYNRIKPKGQLERLGLCVDLADVHARVGHQKEFRVLLDRAIKGFEELAADGQSTKPRLYAGWAKAESMQRNFDEGLRVIDQGLAKHPDNESLIVIHREFCKRLLASGISDRRRVEIAKRLITVDSSTEAVVVVASLAQYVQIKEYILQLLKPMVDSDRLPLEAIELLAMAALSEGDGIEARRLYETILQKDAASETPLNNLAWLLAHEEPIDLERAMSLIDKAIAIDPTNASMHATRGHILTKLQRWDEAIRELEIGLNGMPGNELAHRALANAYEKIGNQELALKHAKILGILPSAL